MTVTAAPTLRPPHQAWTPIRVVALGDSLTSGDGVGVVTPPGQTWAARLADRLRPSSFACLATPGATARVVRQRQLPAALEARPHLATVCVGLNDLVKTGCRPPELAADVSAVVADLRGCGATVVLARLHDPSQVFRLPRGLAQQLSRRVTTVNAAVDAAAAGDTGVVVVDLAPLAQDARCWAVDRVHPSSVGQGLLAAQAADRLGLPAQVPGEDGPHGGHVPSTAAHLWWLTSSGMPWLVRRVGEIGPPVLGMVAAAARQHAPRWPLRTVPAGPPASA